MGTSANFDDNDAAAGGYADLPPGASSQQGATDDMADETGSGAQAEGGARSEGQRGAGGRARDTMDQLHDKASEFTSRLMDSFDMDDFTGKLEQEIRDHPARTLLLAIGAGFLLGRSARK